MFNDLPSLTQLGTTVSLSVEINIAIHCAVTYYDVMGCRNNYLTSPHFDVFITAQAHRSTLKEVRSQSKPREQSPAAVALGTPLFRASGPLTTEWERGRRSFCSCQKFCKNFLLFNAIDQDLTKSSPPPVFVQPGSKEWFLQFVVVVVF